MTTQTNKLYISDLDGTLLDNAGNLSEYSRGKLVTLLSMGINFTVASARSYVSIQEKLMGVPLTLPIIENNGAFISNLHTGKHELVNSIGADIGSGILSIILQHGCFPFVATFNGEDDFLYYQELANEGMVNFFNIRTTGNDKRLRKLDNLNHSLGESVICFTVIEQEDVLEEIEDEINLNYPGMVKSHLYHDDYFPGWYWLTIHDRRAEKGQAVKLLVDKLGFDLSQLVVFGDQTNDVSMFELAPTAIAVSNAVDELKVLATEVIGSNEEDSVVKYIEKDVAGFLA